MKVSGYISSFTSLKCRHKCHFHHPPVMTSWLCFYTLWRKKFKTKLVPEMIFIYYIHKTRLYPSVIQIEKCFLLTSFDFPFRSVLLALRGLTAAHTPRSVGPIYWWPALCAGHLALSVFSVRRPSRSRPQSILKKNKGLDPYFIDYFFDYKLSRLYNEIKRSDQALRWTWLRDRMAG